MFLITACLVLFACFTPSSSTEFTTPPAPSAAAPVVHRASIDEARMRKATAEHLLAQVLADARRSNLVDQGILDYAQWQLDLFRGHFAAMEVEMVLQPDGSTEMRVIHRDQCAENGVPPCFAFVVAELQAAHSAPIAVWNPTAGIMLISPHLPANDGYLPFVLLHELSHAFDTVMNAPLYDGNPIDPQANTEVSGETFAYIFEGIMLDAATRGEYKRQIDKLAQSVLSRKVMYITTLPGPVTYVDVPAEVSLAISGTLSESLAAVTTPRFSAAAQQALAVTIMLDLNHQLIDRLVDDPAANDLQHRLLYANFMAGLRTPPVQEMLRKQHQPER